MPAGIAERARLAELAAAMCEMSMRMPVADASSLVCVFVDLLCQHKHAARAALATLQAGQPLKLQVLVQRQKLHADVACA